MEIVRTAEEQFEIRSGEHALELNQEQYEDIYYALPIETNSLYMLLNETLLSTGEERDVLQAIVDREGGVDESMEELSDLIESVDPEDAEIQGEQSPSKADGEPKSDKTSKKKQKKKKKKKKKKKQKKKKQKQKKKKQSGQKQSSSTDQKEKKKKKQMLASKEKTKKEPTTTEEPQPKTKTPTEASGEVKIIQNYDGSSSFEITRNDDDTFDFSYGSIALRIPFERVQNLFLGLPDNVPKLFKTILTDTLDSDEAREVFRKMLSEAGGIAVCLNNFEEKLEEHRDVLTP